MQMARLPTVILLVLVFLPMFWSRDSKCLRSRRLTLGNSGHPEGTGAQHFRVYVGNTGNAG